MTETSLLSKRSSSLSSIEDNPNKKYKRELGFSFINSNMDKNIDYIAGIDEAGRGPVLGPMVYSIAFYPMPENEKKLRAIGFNDSKQLSEKKRDILFEKMYENDVGFIVDPISAKKLSCDMLRINRRNLNKISHDSAIDLIGRVLNEGFKLKVVYVDTVGVPEKYQKILKDQYPQIPNITVSKKADSIYPIVGAASIAAKVIRDRILESWEFEENITGLSREFGSGYPGDQITKDWLINTKQNLFGFSSLVRYSWGTTVKILKESVQVNWNFEDIQALEQTEKSNILPSKNKKPLEEGSNRAKRNKEKLKKLNERCRYFESTGMSRITEL